MFERILLPVDGSEPSERAAGLAGDAAARLGSEILVLHVIEHGYRWNGTTEASTPGEAMDIVDRYVRRLKDRGLSARGMSVDVRSGRVAATVMEVSRDFAADVIVMGSRGLTDIGGLVMGSVTHKVLHLAEIPVLVVR
ncbi:MAG: universal stress protein [Actinobacteria bacterium]|nr:universal stress protein [Actinomycetota bacterium]